LAWMASNHKLGPMLARPVLKLSRLDTQVFAMLFELSRTGKMFDVATHHPGIVPCPCGVMGFLDLI
ncbi:MAG TPA: hypothetical protein VKP69_32930, partial [Isosphaeraceae bacterium]|nr:hypothetical protein [Isosphaeraceae bacterium]